MSAATSTNTPAATRRHAKLTARIDGARSVHHRRWAALNAVAAVMKRLPDDQHEQAVNELRGLAARLDQKTGRRRRP